MASEHTPSCHTRGRVTAHRLSPDGFSIFLYVAQLDAGSALEWDSGHGDEAVYVMDGEVDVDGARCPTGGAVVVESGVGARAAASMPSTVAHFGPLDPGVPRGVTVHVIGPRGRS